MSTGRGGSLCCSRPASHACQVRTLLIKRQNPPVNSCSNQQTRENGCIWSLLSYHFMCAACAAGMMCKSSKHIPRLVDHACCWNFCISTYASVISPDLPCSASSDDALHLMKISQEHNHSDKYHVWCTPRRVALGSHLLMHGSVHTSFVCRKRQSKNIAHDAWARYN